MTRSSRHVIVGRQSAWPGPSFLGALPSGETSAAWSSKGIKWSCFRPSICVEPGDVKEVAALTLQELPGRRGGHVSLRASGGIVLEGVPQVHVHLVPQPVPLFGRRVLQMGLR